jgi:hypothetical protein
MVKEFLAIFNTAQNTVLPGSALAVTQSWLALSEGGGPAPAILPALLGRGQQCHKCS